MELNSQTTINLGAATTTIVAVISVAIWLHTAIQELRHSIDNVNSQVLTMRADEYGLARAAEDALRMAIENPELRVPDPRDSGRIIQVRRREHE